MARDTGGSFFSTLLTEEAEGQWLSLAVFLMVMVLGAALIHVADVIPSGTEHHPFDDGSEIVSMAFADDGSSLAVVEKSGVNQLFRIQGSVLTEISLPSEPTVVSSSGNSWIVGGKSGLLVRVIGEDTTMLPILLEDDLVLDLHAVDGSSGWILIERGPNVELRTFDTRLSNTPSLSFAADIGDDSLTFTGFDVDSTGTTAIVSGISSSFSNPTSPSEIGRVLFVASSSIGFAPEITLVEHGMGAAYHSIHISQSSQLIGFAVSNDHLTLIGNDLSISTVTDMEGGLASAVDSENRLWVFGNDSTVSVLGADGVIDSLSVESPEDFLPESTISHDGTIHVIFNDGQLLVIDSSSLTDPVRRPSLLFDGIFLAIAVSACLVLARNFQVMGFDAW